MSKYRVNPDGKLVEKKQYPIFRDDEGRFFRVVEWVTGQNMIGVEDPGQEFPPTFDPNLRAEERVKKAYAIFGRNEKGEFDPYPQNGSAEPMEGTAVVHQVSRPNEATIKSRPIRAFIPEEFAENLQEFQGRWGVGSEINYQNQWSPK
jgi:hypothetical protein